MADGLPAREFEALVCLTHRISWEISIGFRMIAFAA
jgi:hypothetical protein